MKGRLAAAVAALAILCAACGSAGTTNKAPAAKGGTAATSAPAAVSGQALVPVRFMFSFIPTGNQVPYYTALDRGYYKSQGLAVSLTKGVTPQLAINSLVAGKVDIAEDDVSVCVDLITKGAKLKVLAVTMQQDPLGLIYLDKHPISKPTDLYGKTVGTFPGTEADSFYKALINVNHLDASRIKTVNVSPATAVGLLSAGKVDAFTGGGYTFLPGMAAKGLKGGVALFGQLGVSALANDIVTTDALIQQHPDVVRKFLYATAQGFAFAQAHPDQAAAYQAKADPTMGQKAIAQELTMSLPFLHGADTQGKPWGWTSPADWASHLKMMQRYLGLQHPQPAANYYTTAYLPGGSVPAP